MTLSNRDYFDISVAKQLYLERVKTGLIAGAEVSLAAYLDNLISWLTTALRKNGSGMSSGSLRRIRTDFRAAERELRQDFDRALRDPLRNFTPIEWQANSVFVEGDRPPHVDIWPQTMGAIAGEDGRTIDDLLRLSATLPGVYLTQALQSSYVLAEGLDEQLERLDDVRQRKGLVGAVVATVVQAIAGLSFMAWIKREPGRYEWVSILDSRTTDICLNLDNKVFVVGKGPRPPAHIRCRSTTAPHYDGRGSTPKITLGQWLKTQVSEFREKAILSPATYLKKVIGYAQAKNQ